MRCNRYFGLRNREKGNDMTAIRLASLPVYTLVPSRSR